MPTHTLPKRALGDITNLAITDHPQPHVYKPNATKIRRTAATKLASSNSAAARRAKSAALAAVAKKASPMSTSNTAPRRQSGRLANRAAAAAAAAVAAVQCKLDFAATTDDEHAPDLATAPYHLPDDVVDIDDVDRENPLAVAHFACEIHDNFVRREAKFMPDPDYMARQQDITVKMRAILIDWLVDVHQKFKLQPETLHLTVNLIDRFLEKTPVMRRKLQLVGVTAMLIASKYEEIYAPEVADFVYISDKAYSKEEILSMEALMLNVLKFEVTVPSSLTFMYRCIKASGSVAGVETEAHKFLTHYLVELALQDSAMLTFRPSVRAAAACKLAARLCNLSLPWESTMTFHSGGWTAKELHACESEMLRLLEHEQDAKGTNKLTAVKRKFSSLKYSSISSTVPEVSSSSQPTSMDICTTE